jgi:hypothetical protein
MCFAACEMSFEISSFTTYLCVVIKRIFPCIGYIGHPFVKEGPWAFIATLSLVARWYSAIDRGGEWFSYTGENRHLWTEAIKEGMQRLLERSAKDFFRHDATNWMDFVCQ